MLNSKGHFFQVPPDTTGKWYTTAARSACVAAVFSLIVAVLLFVNAYHLKVTDIENEELLVAEGRRWHTEENLKHESDKRTFYFSDSRFGAIDWWVRKTLEEL